MGMLLLMMCYMKRKQKKNRAFQKGLSAERKRMRSCKIRRGALLPPNRSPFMHLYRSGQDDALVATTGFDHATFNALHDLFKPFFDGYTPYSDNGLIVPIRRKKKGRRRTASSVTCLGLVLTWTRTRGSLRTLQLTFGLTLSPLSLWLRFGRRILALALRDHPGAKVMMPTEEEIDGFKAAVALKHPVLPNAWGAMDGLKLYLEVSGDELVQNKFYNGWTHDHYIGNLFLFSPDGKIRACYINAPGSIHDSTMANTSNVYEMIDDIYQRTGAQVVVDSAFSKDSRPSLLKSAQHNFDAQGRIRTTRAKHQAATAVRQLSEWGMRGLQGSFPRLKDRIRCEERGERRIIIQLVVYLCNFRASTVGMNQIANTYMPHLEAEGHGSAVYLAN